MANTMWAPHCGEGSDGSVSGFATTGKPSRWRWLMAEATHHAAPRRQKPASAITVNDAPQGQMNADAEYFELSSDEEVAPAREMRPPCLGELSRPRKRVQRHTVEQLIETFVPVPMLDVPVLQSVEQLVDVLKIIDISVREQVDVPKIISKDNIPQRAVLRLPLRASALFTRAPSRGSRG